MSAPQDHGWDVRPGPDNDAAPTVEARAKAPLPLPVTWVRPADLLLSGAGRIAGRGIDLQAELLRRARNLPAEAVSRLGSRDHRQLLPPISVFGGPGARHAVTGRAGLGR